MKKLIGTMLFTTAICGLLAAAPAQASLFGIGSHRDTVTTRSVTNTSLSRSDIISIQRNLAAKGFYRGSIDGKWGPMTSASLASFQSSNGLVANGLPTGETLGMLGVTASNVSYNAPQSIEPASGDVIESRTTSDTYRTRATGGFVAIDTNHENGSTCLLCTNGVIGNGSTPSMRSNEY